VKALDFPLLADENIHPEVISLFRQEGFDIESVSESGRFGLPDTEVLAEVAQAGRVVITHDRDFGGLALMGMEFVGIIYLRPGHIRTDFTMETIHAIRDHSPQVKPKFILVAMRTFDTVKIRVRQL
jgi:predicted nuclease of predicted toxin-antitoxin system